MIDGSAPYRDTSPARDTKPSGAPPKGKTLVAAGLDTYAGSRLLQTRLALLGKTVFLLAFGFFAVMNGILVAGGGLRIVPALVTQANVFHLVSALWMAGLWGIAKAHPWSLRTLGALDAASVLLAGVGLAGMAAQPDPMQLMSGMFALAITMMARAVMIPSTATRTAILSGLAALPLLVVSYVFHEPAAPPGFSFAFAKLLVSVGALLWLTLSVSLSTVMSRTIYGLRQEVKAAAEIGQYVLEEKIGSGGMGEVWRARHRMLIRPAAVKLVTPRELGSGPERDPELRLRRFEREARATAALQSPHTVELYDFGVTEDGTLYYVMELLDGLDLDTLVLRFGPVPPERAIHLLLQVCASLDEAHQNGLVHRDIKPANLVVTRWGTARDFVKVLDFGLVKLESAKPQSDESVKLTNENTVSGTPGFIAPEVVLGENTDHRVDLYSLGCVAYWLLTGKLVFEGSSAVKVMFGHVHTQPQSPSSRSPFVVPPELDALILECLEKDPAKRPATTAALDARLRAVPLAEPWTRERAVAWWNAHAPERYSARPVADVLLSQEARPVRVVRRAPG
jgi:eukaryotic-like serine/threonine-protein kinase